MLITKLVIRVLNATGELMGWTEVNAEARGDGCLWIRDTPVSILIEKAGLPMFQSIHWCDVNVELRQPITDPKNREMGAGELLSFPFDHPAIMCGPAAGGLPPVTIRHPIVVGVPAGKLGVKVH